MGVTKKEEFTQIQNRIAEISKALAHPARIAIVEYLINKQTCICGDLVDVLPIAQATVSQHLKELKKVDLISGEIKPPKVSYCINQEVLAEISLLFKDLFKSMKNCC